MKLQRFCVKIVNIEECQNGKHFQYKFPYFPANLVRLKWKSLRDTYRRRLLRKEGEDDETPTKNWKYNEHLIFLKDQYTE